MRKQKLSQGATANKNGRIRSIEPIDSCRYGKDCPQCADRIAKIRDLIAQGR